jgi:hypothetical protein
LTEVRSRLLLDQVLDKKRDRIVRVDRPPLQMLIKVHQRNQKYKMQVCLNWLHKNGSDLH